MNPTSSTSTPPAAQPAQGLPTQSEMTAAMAVVRYLQGRCISDEELTKISTLDIAHVLNEQNRRAPDPSRAALVAALRAAEEDGRRLDWLEANPDILLRCTWVNVIAGRCWDFEQNGGKTSGECAVSLRVAIDRAIALADAAGKEDEK